MVPFKADTLIVVVFLLHRFKCRSMSLVRRLNQGTELQQPAAAISKLIDELRAATTTATSTPN
jgi:hypothetical protein